MRVALRLIGIGVVLAAGWVLFALYAPYQDFSQSGVYVDIPRGTSQRGIARILAEQGVIRSRLAFEGLSRYHRRKTLQAGEYFFDRPVNAFQVYDAVANGRVYVKQMIVPEGYSMFDIANLVEHEGFTTGDDFLAAARNPGLIRDLAPDAPSLEGFLFPATYEFPRHLSGQEIAAAMVKRFRQKWTQITSEPKGGDPPLALEQTVTLASLVERETPKPDERPEVAGVFTNRLRLGVPLQCDPTVVYAMELAGQFTGKLQASQLGFASPYNTYRHNGLPPGPIANPGEASLRAALDPEPTDYLYFVADANGGHVFSKSLEEHNRNVALYRKRLTEQRSAVSGSLSPNASRAGDAAGWPRRSP